MKKHPLKPTALAFLFMLSLGAAAAPLPDYYPRQFDRIGIIDRIDVGEGQIVIQDNLLLLSPGTAVHSPSRQFVLPRELRKDMKIGYELRKNGDKRVVTEIWILPDSHRLSGDE